MKANYLPKNRMAESEYPEHLSDQDKNIFSPSFNSAGNMPFLQGNVGNRAIYRMFSAGILQPKLSIGKSNDVYELEADRIADKILTMPDAGIQRKKT